MNILIPVLLVLAVGLALAVILTVASKILYVPVDETVAKLSEELPGANCGACGFAGCDDYAKALAKDKTLSTSLCPVGGADVATKLAEILGVDAGSAEKKVAVVMCNGNNDVRKDMMEYQGMQTCTAANQFFGGSSACRYGCLGLGDCVSVCDFNAIHICNGVAVVDREKCVACGKCEKACPKNVIRMAPEKNKVVVECNSKDLGKNTLKACKNGCIGCGKCAKACKFDSITVENNLAFINPDTCKNCGLCAKECPTGAIINMRAKRKVESPADKKQSTKSTTKEAVKKSAAPEKPAVKKESKEESKKVSLKMTKAELLKVAKERNVKVSSKNTKAEIIEKINETK